MRKKNDQLWKGVLEYVFDDLLRFIFPDADKIFDFAKGFEFLDKELNELYADPDKKSDLCFVDKLVKAYKLDGTEEWLLVHLEVQDQHDPNFAERMFRYYYRIYDRYQRPTTAIAIFTGRDGKKLPDWYLYSFWGTRVVYQYNSFCIMDPSDEELMRSENPFAIIVLAARKALLAGKVPQHELMHQKMMLAKMLLVKNLSHQKIQAILSFLRNYIVLQDYKEIRLSNKIDSLPIKNNNMSLLYEIIADMKVEEAKEIMVYKLLKNTEFTHEKIAMLADVDMKFVATVEKEMPDIEEHYKYTSVISGDGGGNAL